MDTKRCPKCGETKPTAEFSKNKNTKDGLQCYCKACVKLNNQKYWESNKDSLLKKNKAYRDKNTESIKANKKRYYEANRELILEKREKDKDLIAEYYRRRRDRVSEVGREWYKNNKEQKLKSGRRYYLENREATLKRTTEWARSNPDKVTEIRHRRRARKANAPGDATAEQIKARFDYYGNKCVYCSTGENLHIEHRIPLSRGGSNWPANLAPACASCNCRKNAKTETEFKAQLATESNDGTAKPDIHTGTEVHGR